MKIFYLHHPSSLRMLIILPPTPTLTPASARPSTLTHFLPRVSPFLLGPFSIVLVLYSPSLLTLVFTFLARPPPPPSDTIAAAAPAVPVAPASFKAAVLLDAFHHPPGTSICVPSSHHPSALSSSRRTSPGGYSVVTSMILALFSVSLCVPFVLTVFFCATQLWRRSPLRPPPKLRPTVSQHAMLVRPSIFAVCRFPLRFVFSAFPRRRTSYSPSTPTLTGKLFVPTSRLSAASHVPHHAHRVPIDAPQPPSWVGHATSAPISQYHPTASTPPGAFPAVLPLTWPFSPISFYLC